MAQAAIPIIAAVISAGGTVYAANQAKKSPKTEKEMRQALYAAIFEKLPEAKQWISQGGDVLQKNLEYFMKAAGGNRQELDEVMNPYYAQTGKMFRQGQLYNQEFGPRAGTSAAMLESPLDLATQNAQASLGFRNFARDQTSQLASGLLSAGQGMLSSSMGGGQGMLNLGMQDRAQQNAMWGQLGAGLGSGLTGSFNMWNALRNPNSQTLSTTTPATQGFSWSGLGAATQGGLGPGVGSGVNAGNFLNLTQQNQPYPTYTSGFLTNPPPGFLGLK